MCVGLANAMSAFEDARVALLTLVADRDDVRPEVAVRPVRQSPRGLHRLFTTRLLRPFAHRLYRRAVRELAPDWIVVNYYPLDAYAMRLRDALGHKVAYYYHNVTDPSLYEGADRARREAEEEAMLEQVALADAVFTNSAFTSNRVMERTGQKATVAFPAADLGLFTPRPAAKASNPTLLHVGRVVMHKGVHLLLDAFALLRERRPNAELRVVGRMEASDYGIGIRRRAEEIGNVRLVGEVDVAALVAELQRAWVFACASLFEGFGMPFLEAQACGVPCIGFDVCSVPEVVEDSRTGVLVPKGDVEAMANAMGDLLDDCERREEMSVAAEARAKTFGWDKSARIIYDRLAQ